jgi:hypothetical protein
VKQVAHHEHRQKEAREQQRDAEDETNRRALTKRQAYNQAGKKEYEAKSNAE